MVCVEVVFFTAGDIKCVVYYTAVRKTISLALHIEERRGKDWCMQRSIHVLKTIQKLSVQQKTLQSF